MGSGGAKKTNQLLQEQTNRANALESELGNRSNAAYQQQGDIRNELLGNYRNLYSGTLSGDGSSSGGGGGGGYTPVEFESTSLPFYTEAMNTGLYSPERMGLAESYATGPIKGMYEGLIRNILSRQRGSGTGVVGAGTGRLVRDQAYAAGNTALAAKLGINKDIDENRFRGAGGVTGLESEKRAFEASERDRAASAAASARSGEAADRAYQLALLGRIEGLMPEDLPYIDRQMGTIGLGTNTVTSRVNETPLWQRALTSIIPSAAGAAAGAFLPQTPTPKKRQNIDYGDLRGEGELY